MAKEKNPPKAPELQEIATIQRDVTRWTYGGVLENLDQTLKTRGAGKGLAIYDELERDGHCFAVLQKRKLAVVARNWHVDAASDQAIDKDAADLVTEQIKGLGKVADDERQQITGFDQTTANFLDATLKGFAIGEVMWERRGSQIWPARIISRDQRRFVFGEDVRLRMLTRENLMLGEQVPPRKFIVHRFGAKDDTPYGKGLGHILFWPVFFKRQDIGFWLVFADKFGSPTAIGKYPAGSQREDKQRLLAALQAIAQDAGIIVPDGMVLELLEAKGRGSTDTYEKLARYMDEQMSLAVLGESITTTAKSTGLGSGVAEKQNEVRLEIAKSDSDMLSDTLNATLVRWCVEYNLPGARPPLLYRNFEEPEDLERRAKIDQALHAMGYEPESLDYINETYGGRWKRKEAKPRPPGAPAIPPGPEFAASDDVPPEVVDQQIVAAAAAALSADWQQTLGPQLDQLVAFAESTGDFVTFRARLAELAAAPPGKALLESLERAGVAARLLGRTPGARDT
jgi:hypothetical protein